MLMGWQLAEEAEQRSGEEERKDRETTAVRLNREGVAS